MPSDMQRRRALRTRADQWRTLHCHRRDAGLVPDGDGSGLPGADSGESAEIPDQLGW